MVFFMIKVIMISLYFEGGAVMREASLDLTTSSQIRRASDSPPMASRAASIQINLSRTESSKMGLLVTSKRKHKSLAEILFPPNLSASEMVRRGRLGKFVSPKKVSEMPGRRFFQIGRLRLL